MAMVRHIKLPLYVNICNKEKFVTLPNSPYLDLAPYCLPGSKITVVEENTKHANSRFSFFTVSNQNT